MYRNLSSNTECSGHKTHCSSQITRSILTAKNDSSDICEYSRNSSCDLSHTTEQRFSFAYTPTLTTTADEGLLGNRGIAAGGRDLNLKDPGLAVDPASFFLISLSPAAIPRLPSKPSRLRHTIQHQYSSINC